MNWEKFKTKNLKLIIDQRGMTYIELIVVLSIFSLISAVAVFNYGAFQDKINHRNLSNDVALKFVEAQKSALSGTISSHEPIAGWRPAYGLYFNLSGSGGADNHNFVYFTDLDNNDKYEDLVCSPTDYTGECLEKVLIPNNSTISEIKVIGDGCPLTVNNIAVVFKRPDTSARINSEPALGCNVSYIQITFLSSRDIPSILKIFSSGRIQTS